LQLVGKYYSHIAMHDSMNIKLYSFFNIGSSCRWVVIATLRPLFTPGKDPVPIVQEVGWATGPVWTSA
jgi:hypothetical protein